MPSEILKALRTLLLGESPSAAVAVDGRADSLPQQGQVRTPGPFPSVKPDKTAFEIFEESEAWLKQQALTSQLVELAPRQRPPMTATEVLLRQRWAAQTMMKAVMDIDNQIEFIEQKQWPEWCPRPPTNHLQGKHSTIKIMRPPRFTQHSSASSKSSMP